MKDLPFYRGWLTAFRLFRTEKDVMAQDDRQSRLLLVGAPYIEINDVIRQIEPVFQESEDDERRELLRTFFCRMDLGLTDGADEARSGLRQDWHIKGRDDLLNVLRWLLREGHSARLTSVLAFCAARPEPAARTIEAYRSETGDMKAFDGEDEATFQESLRSAEDLRPRLPRAGIRAWDLCRYVQVCRVAHLAGFLTAEEAWRFVRQVHKPITEEFEGWESVADSFRLGRIWSVGSLGPFEEACDRLVKHPDSPWQFFGWFPPDEPRRRFTD